MTRPSFNFDWDYAEWPRVIAAIAEKQAGPVVLMGASLGGLTAVFAAQHTNKVVGVIATTLIDMSSDENFIAAAHSPFLGRMSLVGMAAAPSIVDRIKLPLRLAAPLRAMSANSRMAQYFSTDPLIGTSWKPIRFFRTLHDYVPPSLKLGCHLLLAHPGADDWTPTHLSIETFAKVDADKAFVQLTNGSHLPLEQPAYGELIDQIARFLAVVEG